MEINETKYQSVKIKERFEYSKDGKYEKWFENGYKECEGEYMGGKKFGYWKFFYDNGELKEEGEYLDDERNGEWKTYTREDKFNKIESDSGKDFNNNTANCSTKCQVDLQRSDFSVQEFGELGLNEAVEKFTSIDWFNEYEFFMELEGSHLDPCPAQFLVYADEINTFIVSPYYNENHSHITLFTNNEDDNEYNISNECPGYNKIKKILELFYYQDYAEMKSLIEELSE